MTIWVISDTHFNHANILNFRDEEGDAVRDFDSVEQMNECMMDNWNETVQPSDKVYHLGDVLFGMDKQGWLENNWSKLKGKKRLCFGNHDNPKLLEPFFQKTQLWRQFNDWGLLLTHVPVHPSTLEHDRFEGNSVINVHGHIHQNKSPDGPYKCVCVEQTGYKPVNLEELRQ